LRSATEIYESALDHLLSAEDPASFYAVDESGTRRRLPIDQWLADAPQDEETLLARAHAPVLDIGCGAGRHVVALMKRGVEASGVEVSGRATAIARDRKANVFHGSVFDLATPDIWGTALLIDGNIGIGGEPRRLLARTAEMLRPGGFALVELEPPGFVTRVLKLRLEGPDDVSHWFPWAWVGVDEIETLLEGTGMKLHETWSIGERWFAKIDRV
jgi:SAM-dependent methyltransferase